MTNSYGAGGGGVAPATATASEDSNDESNTDGENVHAHMHQILKVVEQARGQHVQRENPSQESPPPVNGTSPNPSSGTSPRLLAKNRRPDPLELNLPSSIALQVLKYVRGFHTRPRL